MVSEESAVREREGEVRLRRVGHSYRAEPADWKRSEKPSQAGMEDKRSSGFPSNFSDSTSGLIPDGRKPASAFDEKSRKTRFPSHRSGGSSDRALCDKSICSREGTTHPTPHGPAN